MTITMNFDKENVVRILLAVEYSIKDLENTVVCCPDPEHFAAELRQYRAEIEALRALHRNIHAAIQESEDGGAQPCKLILLN